MKQHFLGKIYKERLIKRLTATKSSVANTFAKIPFNMEVYKIIRLEPQKPFHPRLGLCTLIIPRGTKIYRTAEKCRAAKAYVRKINVVEFVLNQGYEVTDLLETKGHSDFDPFFKYEIGKNVIPGCFNTDRRQCGGGIHFFLTEKNALEYIPWL